MQFVAFREQRPNQFILDVSRTLFICYPSFYLVEQRYILHQRTENF